MIIFSAMLCSILLGSPGGDTMLDVISGPISDAGLLLIMYFCGLTNRVLLTVLHCPRGCYVAGGAHAGCPAAGWHGG
jgi:hypothetical protein